MDTDDRLDSIETTVNRILRDTGVDRMGLDEASLVVQVASLLARVKALEERAQKNTNKIAILIDEQS